MEHESEPVGDIEIDEHGIIKQRFEPHQRPINPEDFPVVMVNGVNLGIADHDSGRRTYFIEFTNPQIDVPLRIGMSRELTEHLVSGLIELVEGT